MERIKPRHCHDGAWIDGVAFSVERSLLRIFDGKAQVVFFIELLELSANARTFENDGRVDVGGLMFDTEHHGHVKISRNAFYVAVLNLRFKNQCFQFDLVVVESELAIRPVDLKMPDMSVGDELKFFTIINTETRSQGC